MKALMQSSHWCYTDDTSLLLISYFPDSTSYVLSLLCHPFNSLLPVVIVVTVFVPLFIHNMIIVDPNMTILVLNMSVYDVMKG